MLVAVTPRVVPPPLAAGLPEDELAAGLPEDELAAGLLLPPQPAAAIPIISTGTIRNGVLLRIIFRPSCRCGLVARRAAADLAM
jgi:hypothetical protein